MGGNHGADASFCLTVYAVQRNIHCIAMYSPTQGNGSQDGKWEAQLRKGCLELAILASLSRGKLYGLEILRVLQDEAQLLLAEGTVYPILSRLKQEGLLESEWVEADAGHPRKYYWLTDAGRRQAESMARSWASFAANLTRTVEPLLNGKE
jgi:PadR family transcriptional regulator, regulatory protein PadR